MVVRRCSLLAGPGRVGAAILLPLLFGAGCATTRFDVEPRSSEITWRPSAKTSPTTPATDVADQQSKLRAAEQSGDDMAVAEALYELAVTRREQGQLTAAEQLYQRALDICERERGPESLDVAAILNNLAGVKAAQGEYDAARPLLERALSIRRTELGDDDPLTAQSMSNLALLYAAQGNAALAEPLYREALAVFEKGDGSSQDDLVQVLENYAALLRDTGRDAEAEKLELRAGMIAATGARAGSTSEPRTGSANSNLLPGRNGADPR